MLAVKVAGLLGLAAVASALPSGKPQPTGLQVAAPGDTEGLHVAHVVTMTNFRYPKPSSSTKPHVDNIVTVHHLTTASLPAQTSVFSVPLLSSKGSVAHSSITKLTDLVEASGSKLKRQSDSHEWNKCAHECLMKQITCNLGHNQFCEALARSCFDTCDAKYPHTFPSGASRDTIELQKRQHNAGLRECELDCRQQRKVCVQGGHDLSWCQDYALQCFDICDKTYPDLKVSQPNDSSKVTPALEQRQGLTPKQCKKKCQDENKECVANNGVTCASEAYMCVSRCPNPSVAEAQDLASSEHHLENALSFGNASEERQSLFGGECEKVCKDAYIACVENRENNCVLPLKQCLLACTQTSGPNEKHVEPSELNSKHLPPFSKAFVKRHEVPELSPCIEDCGAKGDLCYAQGGTNAYCSSGMMLCSNNCKSVEAFETCAKGCQDLEASCNAGGLPDCEQESTQCMFRCATAYPPGVSDPNAGDDASLGDQLEKRQSPGCKECRYSCGAQYVQCIRGGFGWVGCDHYIYSPCLVQCTLTQPDCPSGSIP